MYYSPTSSKEVPVAFTTHFIEIYGYIKKKDLQYDGSKLWYVFVSLDELNGTL